MFRGQGDQGVKLTTHLHLLSREEWVAPSLHYPICIHDFYRDNFSYVEK
jgi:hypothetical protein